MAIFAKRQNTNVSHQLLDSLVDQIRLMINDGGDINPSIAKIGISTEGYSENDIMQLESSVHNVRNSIEGICGQLGLTVPNPHTKGVSMEGYNDNRIINEAQIEAGVAGAIISGDIRAHLNNPIRTASSYGSTNVVQYAPSDATTSRVYTLSNEAYNENNIKEAQIFTVAYNLQASRQDEFCETFFPTLVITPDQVGFGITISLMGVFDDYQHKLDGDRAAFVRKNLVHAVIDPTILKNDLTRLVPAWREGENDDKFVPKTLIAPRIVDVDGIQIKTQPYAVNKECDLIGLCTTDDLVATGLMDFTDTIDSGTVLENIYFKFGDDVLKFGVSTLQQSNFTEAPQGDYRQMQLSFKNNSILINKNTTCHDGSEMTTLAAIKNGDYRVRLKVYMTGYLRVDDGSMELIPGSVDVSRIIDSTNQPVSIADPAVAGIVAAIRAGSIIGFDLKAYRLNNNRRTRGQLITTWEFTQKYNVNLRSPITAVTPINSNNGSYNNSDLNALITATRIRSSNEGVGKLIEAATLMSVYVDARDEAGECPDILGLGGTYIRPTYFIESIDVNDSIDSLTSHERAADIQSVLVNKIRDYVYRMYRDSEYKAAADILNSGIGPMPTVIIGTDPVISRYLQITGDLRTIGNDFNLKIVTTLDQRVIGKIFITFGLFDEARNTEPNILNFGNFLYSPEVTIQVPITRNGQISHELAVQPRFLHICHLPILTVLEVFGIRDSLNKVPIEIVNRNTEYGTNITYRATTDITYRNTKVYYKKVGNSYVALSETEAKNAFNAANGTAPTDIYIQV